MVLCWFPHFGPKDPQILEKVLDLRPGAGRGSQVPDLPWAMPAAAACHRLSAVSSPMSHLSRLLSPSCH